MNQALSLIARQAFLAGLRNALDAGGGGRALFFAGTPPGTPGETPTDAPLGTVPLAGTSGTVGVLVGEAGALATLTLAVPRAAQASFSGEIGFMRLADGSNQGFLDLLAGVEGSGAPVTVSVTQVFAGGEIQLLSCVIAL